MSKKNKKRKVVEETPPPKSPWVEGSWDLDKLRMPEDVDLAFPAKAPEFMPSIELLGGWDAVLKLERSPWGELAQNGFYRGWKKAPEFKPGITEDQQQKVLRIIKVVMGTFACKHEHKIATLAFLLDKFFVWDDSLKGS